MTESKKRREPVDRLSELPDSLIFHIFWFLPMDNFVRTTVLSSRWKTLWTTTPYLNFRFSEFYGNDTFEPRDFINRALLSWRGIRILKFRIEFMYPDWDEDESLRIDFDLWMRFAVEKKVGELYLPKIRFDESICEYKMPQCLHSCSSLRVLLIPGCYIQIKGNLQWSQLRSLTMDGGSMSDCEHVINHILYGTPRLEVLILTFWDSEENLSIRSSSLKKLLIENFLGEGPPAELRIWAPNLETLEILGNPHTKCLLMNASSLTHATLQLLQPVEIRREDFSGDDFLGETLRQIVPSIQHVEMVRLLNWSIKVLEHMTNANLVSPFLNVMFLNIKEYDEEYEDVFEIFPELKMLVLLDEDECQPSLKFDFKSSLKFVPSRL